MKDQKDLLNNISNIRPKCKVNPPIKIDLCTTQRSQPVGRPTKKLFENVFHKNNASKCRTFCVGQLACWPHK